MKQAIFLLHFAFCILYSKVQAQSIGIGTSNPDASARLHISSGTQGLLIPGMTVSQMYAITNPANGLLVYNTDYDQLYHYNGLAWTGILNGSYWLRQTPSRKRISNFRDSVGIGTLSPTQWLDVDGNIRSRNNFIVDNNISATGNVNAANMITTGNIAASGTSFLNSAMTTNSGLNINNSAGILQLASSNVSKAFMQLSGNNLRIGTNSGNSSGNLLVRMNTNNVVTVTPSGNIDIAGKLTNISLNDTASILPLCYGRTDLAFTTYTGTPNATVSRVTKGKFEISCPGLTSTSTIILSINETYPEIFPNPSCQYAFGVVSVWFYSLITSDYEDVAFSFVIYK